MLPECSKDVITTHPNTPLPQTMQIKKIPHYSVFYPWYCHRKLFLKSYAWKIFLPVWSTRTEILCWFEWALVKSSITRSAHKN
jgi:hypothetical protein